MRKLVLTLALLSILTVSVSAGPLLTTTVMEVKFGTAPQYAELHQTIVIHSKGDEPAVIDNINTYCKCLEIPFDSTPIPPGDSVVLDIYLSTQNFVGQKSWGIHVMYNNKYKLRFNVDVMVANNIENLRNLSSFPYIINASQFGDTGPREFEFKLINKTDVYIPLELKYVGTEYFTLDFPGFIPPSDTAVGKITLTEKGLAADFDETIIFEFVDKFSEKQLYSLPVMRKIYK